MFSIERWLFLNVNTFLFSLILHMSGTLIVQSWVIWFIVWLGSQAFILTVRPLRVFFFYSEDKNT
jgi:hypothetical protein